MDTIDLLVIGGGVTGAAVLREAARCGVRAMLVERGDFASGTSSRSTKLAQGGLRYLDTGDLALVRESVRERDRLVRDSHGLARPLRFVCSTGPQDGRKYWKMRAGITLYALLSGRMPGRPLDAASLGKSVPGLAIRPDSVGLTYEEADVDDARLVYRLLQEATDRGAVARSYMDVESLLRDGDRVVGARVRDLRTGRLESVRARAVVNATGTWASTLLDTAESRSRLRPLRGSHLLFPSWRLPLASAVSFRHPRDGRFVCAVPWEDVVVVGTTDVDQGNTLDFSPRVSEAEADYLLEAARHAFADAELTAGDVVSCFAGIRPVVDDREGAPSAASRGHVTWTAPGLVTITGGKLTTCRRMAHDALATLKSDLPALARLDDAPFFDPPAQLPPSLSSSVRARLSARFGPRAADVLATAHLGDLDTVRGTATLWLELRWALRHEQVEHLDDLLLRRTRLGLFLRNGARELMPALEVLCREELGWDAARFAEERARYERIHAVEHALPGAATRVDPDGLAMLEAALTAVLRDPTAIAA